LLAEFIFDMFTGIEKAFELTVDEKVCVGTEAGDIAHIVVQASLQLILDEGIGPVVMASTEYNTLECLNFKGEQRIFKPVFAVSAAEIKPETEFRVSAPYTVSTSIARSHIIATVYTQAAVYLEV
jgi:hypothetical protein